MGKTALSIGANTFQFFTRNPRGGKAKAVNPEDAAALVRLCQENNFAKLLAHAPYTMNPCAADEGLRDFARNVMEGDLEMLEYVPGNLYNFHPGSHVKQGVEVGIEKISAMLNEVLHKDLHTTVLLETMAGKGSEMGKTFEQLAAIYDGVTYNEKLRVCFDTCHVFILLESLAKLICRAAACGWCEPRPRYPQYRQHAGDGCAWWSSDAPDDWRSSAYA